MTNDELKREATRCIRTLHLIYDCDGYRETKGREWLGPRLTYIEDFLNNLVEDVVDEEKALAKARFYGKRSRFYGQSE